MTLYEILKAKGSAVFTIGSDATLEEVVGELVRRNVGCLVVCDRGLEEGERLTGVISERDILRFCASGKGPLGGATVASIMTTQVITGTPQDSVEATMGLMTTHRVRHLPVLVGGRLVGIVSIGDIVKFQHDHLALENQFMKNYLTG
jgi:CBS domain-containing protein